MKKDEVFKKPIKKQFVFDDEVAGVFDDMLPRSIPHYADILELTVYLADKFLDDDDALYDLGCSTATTLIKIAKKTENRAKLVGIDSSAPMLKIASSKAKAYGARVEFVESDILKADLKGAKVVIANFTLQFVRPIIREELVKKIFDSLSDGGVFIFSEKVITEDAKLNRLIIERYHEFKKANGYSEFEIAQKREALENVLVPYTAKENEAMCIKCGFKSFETLFRDGNFALFAGAK